MQNNANLTLAEILAKINAKDYQLSYYQQIKKHLPSFQLYIDTQIISGVLLIITTLIAIVWATVPALHHSYFHLIHYPLGLLFGDQAFTMSVQDFVNDVLLTLFFFVLGLEIKREVLVGELSDNKVIVNVTISALGGILIPALIYIALTYYTPYLSGWAIPISSDTAFAMGILSLFKRTIPPILFIFIAALTVVDDIVTVLLIGVFYSKNVMHQYLIYSAGVYGLLLLMNVLGVHRSSVYLILGLIFWALIESAGIHGTIAGILVAMAIPARSQVGPHHLFLNMRTLIKKVDIQENSLTGILNDTSQHAALEKLEKVCKQATTPLLRWTHSLKIPVLLFVLPVFALANGGIRINTELLQYTLHHSLALAIILGLVIGKPAGILLFTYLNQKWRAGTLPGNLKTQDIIGVALLSGMGFTMSLFITDLNFVQDSLPMEVAKLAVVCSSLLASLLGSIWLWWRYIWKVQQHSTLTYQSIKEENSNISS